MKFPKLFETISFRDIKSLVACVFICSVGRGGLYCTEVAFRLLTAGPGSILGIVQDLFSTLLRFIKGSAESQWTEA